MSKRHGVKGTSQISRQAEPPITLTRRELLASAAIASAAVIAACAPAQTTTRKTTGSFTLSRPATITGDATIPAAMSQAAAKLQPPHALAGGLLAPTGGAPDLLLTFGTLPASYVGATVGTSPATLLTHMRVPIDTVTADDAKKLLSGALTDWSQAGAPYSLPVRLMSLGGLALPAGLSLAPTASAAGDPFSLSTEMNAQKGSLVVLPVEHATWQLRNLGVDGIYPAQGRGDLAKATLPPFTLTLGVSKALSTQGLDPKALVSTFAALLWAGGAVVDMVSVGDIMLGRGVNNQMLAHDYTFPYQGMRDDLQAANVRVANLECTITDLVAPPSDPTTFTFISAKKAVEGLTYAGFNLITVANNHSAGPGKAAMLDMLATLRAKNITVTGAGPSLAEATKPAIVTAKGVRFAMLGYHDGKTVPFQGQMAKASDWGLAPVNLDTLPQDLAAARQQADVVIPYFHWGIEYTKTPMKLQQQIARAAIDAGADLVLGNHPHWTQGVEFYNNKLIIYSMGNFIFDQDWSRPTKESIIFHLYWRGASLSSVRLVPTIDVSRCQPTIMTQADAVDVFQRMWSGSDILASGVYGPEAG